MNNSDVLQAILLKCETEITNGHIRPASAGTLADEILAIIEQAGAETEVMPRPGKGLARLQISKPLVCFDLETSSAEIDEAKIIEIAAIKIHPDGTKEIFHTLINPGFDISEEIEKLTSITNEDLESAFMFSHYAQAFLEFITGCYLTGYNVRNFDGPVLGEEFFAAGLTWRIKQSEILDAMEIFYKMEPRTLTGAGAFYCQKDHSGAHRAMPDVEMTLDVLDAQLGKYQGLPDGIDALIEETKRDNRLDLAGNIVLIDGVACFGFGKHKNKPCHTQRGYCKWMLDQKFSNNTKMVIDSIIG